MVSDNLKNLSVDNCIKFLEDLQADLSWQWDGRFKTALSHISSDGKNRVTVMLESHLGTAWNSDTIDKAPEIVHRLITPLGGVMPGQLFYAAGQEDDIVFCSWWPWNNGQTISIRIGTNGEGVSLLDTLVPPGTR